MILRVTLYTTRNFTKRFLADVRSSFHLSSYIFNPFIALKVTVCCSAPNKLFLTKVGTDRNGSLVSGVFPNQPNCSSYFKSHLGNACRCKHTWKVKKNIQILNWNHTETNVGFEKIGLSNGHCILGILKKLWYQEDPTRSFTKVLVLYPYKYAIRLTILFHVHGVASFFCKRWITNASCIFLKNPFGRLRNKPHSLRPRTSVGRLLSAPAAGSG